MEVSMLKLMKVSAFEVILKWRTLVCI